MLSGRKILLGISGSIAAYKAAELCRLLVKAGASVRVAMTEAAAEFVSPLTFHTLSGKPVAMGMFGGEADSPTTHIEIAREADLLLVAPATARTISRISTGLAEDLVSTAVIASDCPVVVAPAMNVQMYHHPAVQENVARLRSWEGYHIAGPSAGEQACGEVGLGRLSEPEFIVDFCRRVLAGSETDLLGRRVLITAGPTCEDLDPVRFLTNRSSGRMGYALAETAARRGAETILVSGPTSLTDPPGVIPVAVRSARQMADAVLQRQQQSDVIIMSAAVADYTPARSSDGKIKKGDGPLSLELVRTTDILGRLLEQRCGDTPLLIGFAAETGDLERRCAEKIQRKPVDLLVGNDVSATDSGFAVDTNRVLLMEQDGNFERLPLLNKSEVADRILDRVSAKLR